MVSGHNELHITGSPKQLFGPSSEVQLGKFPHNRLDCVVTQKQ